MAPIDLSKWRGLNFSAAWAEGRLARTDRLIGESSRQVFECSLDPDLVVKMPAAAAPVSTMQNLCEYYLWTVADSLRWVLAPCIWMSPCAGALIQLRTGPATVLDLPSELPSACEDIKDENVGRLADRVVFHDYGSWGLKAIRDAVCSELAGEPRPPLTRPRDEVFAQIPGLAQI